MSRRFKPGIQRSQGGRRQMTQDFRRQRRRARINPSRTFVPRTMGAFAMTESKYFDSFGQVTVAESTDWTSTEADPGTLNTLFVPQEGSDLDNRIGRQVHVTRMAIRGIIAVTAESALATMLNLPAVRLILFQDQQTNGVQAQGEQLMAAPGAATQALTFSTFQNTANFGRFRVLRDKTVKLGLQASFNDAATTGTVATQHIPFKMNVRFRTPMSVRFNATNGGTIGDIVDNSFHLLAQKSGVGFTHTLSYQCRTYYKDG